VFLVWWLILLCFRLFYWTGFGSVWFGLERFFLFNERVLSGFRAQLYDELVFKVGGGLQEMLAQAA
jgi:hypothetical protein